MGLNIIILLIFKYLLLMCEKSEFFFYSYYQYFINAPDFYLLRGCSCTSDTYVIYKEENLLKMKCIIVG